MKKRIYLFIILIVSLALLSTGCGTKATTAPISSATPSEAVKSYFSALKEARYDDAQKQLSTSLQKTLEGQGKLSIMATKNVSDELKKRNFNKVDIIKEDIKGEEATVNAKLIFKDNNIGETLEFKLVKEDKEWKLDNSKKS